MGSSTYSASVFNSTIGAAAAKGVSSFHYDSSVRSGAAPAVVHPDLDPKLVAGPKSPYAGKVMRESRDSAAHPNSLAISILFDVTGSVGRGPRVFIEKLGALMSLLVKKGYVLDPQILSGAIGDETSDQVPLQIGQFESGNEMDQALAKVYIEGGGGGQSMESYELAMYFMARHTSADCWEKRGQKGYLFIVGDEMYRPKVSAGAIKRVIDPSSTVTEDIPTTTIIEELREKYEVFWLFPNCSSYYSSDETAGPLKATFEQNFLKLEKIEEIAEVIAATIGVAQGFNPKDVVKDLVDAGFDPKAANRVTTLSATVGTGTLAKKTGTVDGTLIAGGADSVARL